MGRDSAQYCILGNIPQGVRCSLDAAAGFGVSSNTRVFLVRVYFGDLFVTDNSWIGGLLAMVSVLNEMQDYISEPKTLPRGDDSYISD